MTDEVFSSAARWSWTTLPLVMRRCSKKLTLKLVDGHYLAAWPPVAAILPPAALLAGLLIGWRHWGFTTVFTESLLVMALAAALGILGANAGLHFVVGFALGDFFLSDTVWFSLIQTRIPRLIEYGLLGLLATTVPIFTKTLLAQLAPPDALSRKVRFGMAVVGHAAVTGVLVYLWCQAAPILIRPVFTWPGGAPPVPAVAPLQQNGMRLVWAAVLFSLVRMTLQGLTSFQPAPSARVDALERTYAAAPAVKPLIERVPTPVRLLWQTAVSLLLLAGMLQFWLDALLLGGLIFALQAARERFIPVPLGPWPAMVERIPLLFRLMAGFFVVYLAADAFLTRQMGSTDTFRPIVVLVGLAMIVMFLLAPGQPKPVPAQGGGESA